MIQVRGSLLPHLANQPADGNSLSTSKQFFFFFKSEKTKSPSRTQEVLHSLALAYLSNFTSEFSPLSTELQLQRPALRSSSTKLRSRHVSEQLRCSLQCQHPTAECLCLSPRSISNFNFQTNAHRRSQQAMVAPVTLTGNLSS